MRRSRREERGFGDRERAPGNARAHKEQTARPVVYGVLPVLELLRSESRKVDKVIIAEGSRESRISQIIDLARQKGILIERSSRDTFGRYLPAEVNHQGVLALTSAGEYADADDILNELGEDALVLILDGIEDPRNLGAILRTAECAGVKGVFIPERRAVGLTDTVAKSSAGASEYVKVAKVPNLNRLIDRLKEKGIWVVGAAGDAVTEYADWDWKRPTALIVGSEGRGLHRLVSENCDVLVKIPMYGKIGSLNVSVAAGVILFEAQRQRAAIRTEPIRS